MSTFPRRGVSPPIRQPRELPRAFGSSCIQPVARLESDSAEIVDGRSVVNLLATHDGTAPSEVALYYPLTPSLAMILSPKSLNLRPAIARVAAPCVRELNDLIAWKSDRKVSSRPFRQPLAPLHSPGDRPTATPAGNTTRLPTARHNVLHLGVD